MTRSGHRKRGANGWKKLNDRFRLSQVAKPLDKQHVNIIYGGEKKTQLVLYRASNLAIPKTLDRAPRDSVQFTHAVTSNMMAK